MWQLIISSKHFKTILPSWLTSNKGGKILNFMHEKRVHWHLWTCSSWAQLRSGTLLPSFLLVIGHFPPWTYSIGKDILLFCGLWVRGFSVTLNYRTHGKYHFLAHKEVIQGSSWNRAEYSAAAIPFPNLHFNLEMMTGANIELVDVSQRGQTSPSVSIIAARQVSLSHPHGGLPSWIRGDAPLPLWPQKPQGETAGCDTVSMISTHWI